ncbi:hypothetical protein ACFL36_04415 [Thermodesulfobacteriota bacterium]
MNIKKSINILTDLVQREINEEILLSKGEELIDSLRNCWKSQKDKFAEDDVQLLIKMSSQLASIQEFTEILEDFPYLTVKEDVDETIGALFSVVEKVEGLAVAARIHKEIRELMEKKASLPFQESREKNVKLSNAITRLESNAPTCKKCGERMVIRGGNGAYFWGCSMFPQCWGKRWLSKVEVNLLPD